MTDIQIINELKDILSTIKPSMDLSAVDRLTNLVGDLGLDSLSLLLLSLSIESKFSFTFDGTPKFVTVGDVVDFIKEKTNGQA